MALAPWPWSWWRQSPQRRLQQPRQVRSWLGQVGPPMPGQPAQPLCGRQPQGGASQLALVPAAQPPAPACPAPAAPS
eukprot:15442926-Alexandrium_andersonii.AAC.1